MFAKTLAAMFAKTMTRSALLFPLLAGLLCVTPASLGLTARAQQFSVQAAIEKNQVFVGESFVFQIQIEGSDSPEKPDVSAISDFTIQELGGQQNSSQSMTIINGQVNQVVKRGYIFSYRLTPKREGRLSIPSISVSADGKSMATRPIAIQATPPSETNDFKLRMSLSERKAYVGQPVTLTTTWYVGKDVREFSFNVPALDDDRFDVAGSDPVVDQNRRDRYVAIPLGDSQIIGEKGKGSLEGKEYVTVRFSRTLIPKRAGNIALPTATVTCQTLKGYSQNRGRRSNDFFGSDFFGMGRRAVYETAVVPSNSPALQVLKLPTTGRPAGFSGLVGKYKIAAEATPSEMNVGDPITLTVKISGPPYLGNVRLPPLATQSNLNRDFKIPQERAPGTLKSGGMVFTQTIRARHSEIDRIPPIELTYFDPASGQYQRAGTEAIPITVASAKIVTARDAEGIAISGSVQTELESLEGGIAANYEDFDALQVQAWGPVAWLHSAAWASLIFLPPLTYAGLLAFVVFSRRRDSDPAQRLARQAFRALSKDLKAIDVKGMDTVPSVDAAEQDAALLQALRQYLGNRVGLAPGALTFADVEQRLTERGVDRGLIQILNNLFERCEAGRYAGGTLGGQTGTETARQIRDAAEKLEQSLK